MPNQLPSRPNPPGILPLPSPPAPPPAPPPATTTSTPSTVSSQFPPSPPRSVQHFPDLQGKVHPDVEIAIRNLYLMMYDVQGGIQQLSRQLIGGAVATATLVGTAINSITMATGGYYLVPPVVTTSPLGGAVLKAIMTGTKVTGVQIVKGGSFTSTPTVVFTP
jgi:hypothetical protein